MLFVFLIYKCVALKADRGYTMKIAGKDDIYIAKVKNNVRMVPHNYLHDKLDFMNVLYVDEDPVNYFNLKFCNSYLSSKTSDPGIVLATEKSKNTQWRVLSESEGFKLEQNGKCLVMMPSFDGRSETNGYYMNLQPCNSSYPMVFTKLLLGYIPYYAYCQPNLIETCRDAGLVPCNTPCETFPAKNCIDLSPNNQNNNNQSPIDSSRNAFDGYIPQNNNGFPSNFYGNGFGPGQPPISFLPNDFNKNYPNDGNQQYGYNDIQESGIYWKNSRGITTVPHSNR
ncbi:hypothetical protein EDEG_00965 [Edhazardia aedis USNM 41457]|uniref:Uncharacterized protein n=1 Tax=Edhazardia aedis (strain USNM 41457) TaxID=1003232 RepID=J8ZYS4_EDHAE|nr:hypothetical protein EDEG_00965 [Edhazardia aedis USNM 41457]|eukprot:EJW04828.1 hypothetical protein EDEG_00965 [Edhazardia aedis USNM 41457]